MRNCWSFAVREFERHSGWLLVRFTRRSSASPSRVLGWIGAALVVAGLVAINFGAWLRTGRWLHVYHALSVQGPYRSYEPSNGGPAIKRPPFDFDGAIEEHSRLF